MSGHYSRYFVRGTAVCFGAPDDNYVAATCATEEAAAEAAKLMADAMWLNDVKRRYTAAARKLAQAEALPGFAWPSDATN